MGQCLRSQKQGLLRHTDIAFTVQLWKRLTFQWQHFFRQPMTMTAWKNECWPLSPELWRIMSSSSANILSSRTTLSTSTRLNPQSKVNTLVCNCIANSLYHNRNEKSAQRDANTARVLAVVRFGHRPPAHHTHTPTDRTDYNTLRRS